MSRGGGVGESEEEVPDYTKRDDWRGGEWTGRTGRGGGLTYWKVIRGKVEHG